MINSGKRKDRLTRSRRSILHAVSSTIEISREDNTGDFRLRDFIETFIIDIKYFNIRRKIGLAKIDILLMTIRRNRIEMVYNDYKP